MTTKVKIGIVALAAIGVGTLIYTGLKKKTPVIASAGTVLNPSEYTITVEQFVAALRKRGWSDQDIATFLNTAIM